MLGDLEATYLPFWAGVLRGAFYGFFDRCLRERDPNKVISGVKRRTLTFRVQHQESGIPWTVSGQSNGGFKWQ